MTRMHAARGGQVGRCLALVAVFAWTAVAGAESPDEIEIFEKLVGKWESEGTIHAQDSAETIEIREKWEGALDSRGHFVVQGERVMNGTPAEFTWNYFYNPTTEMLQAISTDSTNDSEQTWQVSVDESNAQITLELQVGDEARLVLTLEIGDGEIEVNAALRGPGDTATHSGTIKHKRVT